MSVASAPLTLQIGLRIHGSMEGPLGDGSTIASGDRIQVLARTTEDAHLYLAYCTSNRELSVYPEYGSIIAPAGETTVAPGKEAFLVVDDHVGSEALYVILSRADLAGADPRLANALKDAQRGDMAADCGGGFQQAVAMSSAPTTSVSPVPTGANANPSARPATGNRRARARRSSAITRPGGSSEPPLVTIERGMYVNQSGLAEVTTRADANGIAILHYRFQHVAAPRL